jgi:hypothetical protein
MVRVGAACSRDVWIRQAPFRHSGLDQSLPRSAVRPFSVIPAKAEPALDSIRGIHVHRDDTTEDLPEGGKISSATFSRSKWTPGLWPGVTGTERTWIRPVPFRHSGLDHNNLPRCAVRLFSVIPDLIRNPFLSERAGGRISGRGRNISGNLQPIDMDPGSRPAFFPSSLPMRRH